MQLAEYSELVCGVFKTNNYVYLKLLIEVLLDFNCCLMQGGPHEYQLLYDVHQREHAPLPPSACRWAVFEDHSSFV